MNDNAISNDSTIKIHQIIMYSNKVIHYLLRIITHSPHFQVVPDCDRHCRSSGELASISGSWIDKPIKAQRENIIAIAPINNISFI